MTQNRREITSPLRRLPDINLSLGNGEGSVRLRAPGRKSPVLLILHGAGCPECEAYVEQIASRQADITDWDGRVLVVLPDRDEAVPTSPVKEPFPVAVDTEQRVAAALSVQIPSLVIADQWGEIHWVEEAGPDHRLIAPEEIVEWLRYLAIQCPECQGEAF